MADLTARNLTAEPDVLGPIRGPVSSFHPVDGPCAPIVCSRHAVRRRKPDA